MAKNGAAQYQPSLGGRQAEHTPGFRPGSRRVDFTPIVSYNFDVLLKVKK